MAAVIAEVFVDLLAQINTPLARVLAFLPSFPECIHFV
jgi:hypothetical protein